MTRQLVSANILLKLEMTNGGEVVMPVSMGTNGSCYTIMRVTGSGAVRAHLNSMGFNPGTQIMVISKLSGNVILAVKDTRVAINEEQARHILV